MLFQGVKLLLADGLVDWQSYPDAQQVAGIFKVEGKTFVAQLDWPMSHSGQDILWRCSCIAAQDDKNPCAHLAALAVECKTRFDRIALPIRAKEACASEWDYYLAWQGKQCFDPFPNMARHRVVYLVNWENNAYSLEIQKAYLTLDNEFQPKADLPIATWLQSKLPKFFSLVDQWIFYQLQKALKVTPELLQKDNKLQLTAGLVDLILPAMLASGRAFWKTCYRKPLKWSQSHLVAKLQPSFSELAELSSRYRLQTETNSVLELGEAMPGLLSDWLSEGADLSLEQTRLKIASAEIVMPWQKGLVARFDYAEVEFVLASRGKTQVVSSGQLNNLLKNYPQCLEQAWLQQAAVRLHQLEGLPSLASHFEFPLCREFDPDTRLLAGDISHWFVLFNGLHKTGWQLELTLSFRLNQLKAKNWYGQVSGAKSGQEQGSWFEIELGVKVGEKSVNLLPHLVKLLKQGLVSPDDPSWPEQQADLLITLEDGSLIAVDGFRVKLILQSLLELGNAKPLNQHKRLQLATSQFALLGLLPDLVDQPMVWQDADWLKSRLRSLQRGRRVEQVSMPGNVKAVLRPYQLQGVSWLQFLAENQLGGVLADDMGLGKTLQTLAHIQIQKNTHPDRGSTLVVAPTSLLANWMNEAKKFTPELKLGYWAGSLRHQSQADMAGCDLIITSYGVLQRDYQFFNQLNLHLVVLDEAQAIKNASSKIAKTLVQLKSVRRLCVTGTPLENHLGELWSLFHFLMPGFLGDAAQFKRLFRNPIEKDQDQVRLARLVQRISPFILRRSKDQVATDLPPKTHILELVELDEIQSDIYETLRLTMVDEVRQTLTGQKPNYLMVTNMLLRLRQICCHPLLLRGGRSASLDAEQLDWVDPAQNRDMLASLLDKFTALKADPLTDYSAKMKWLETSLPEMVENGRAILIFSSFRRMLELIAELLDRLGLKHLMLTGKTRNRASLVEAFQRSEAPIFLISLKAGGTGLNLTRADTVIHFDPWWNPAAEEQASDRAHRIGQDKPVFIYKLIGKGTVEERIARMQSEKAQLSQGLLAGQNQAVSATDYDWQILLQPVDQSIE